MISYHGRKFAQNAEGGGILYNISDNRGGSAKGTKKPWSKKRKEHYKEWCKNYRIFDPQSDELYDMYINQKMTRQEIAIKYNVSVSLVKNRLKELNIIKPKNVRYPKKKVFTCLHCSSDIVVPNSVSLRKFCSKTCQKEYNSVARHNDNE